VRSLAGVGKESRKGEVDKVLKSAAEALWRWKDFSECSLRCILDSKLPGAKLTSKSLLHYLEHNSLGVRAPVLSNTLDYSFLRNTTNRSSET